ncbi:MAG: hypothetical protein JNK27_11155 [Chitinophagaceae bacterium]|nr:hypothetical protein [Chitinophagaceae bacterium]
MRKILFIAGIVMLFFSSCKERHKLYASDQLQIGAEGDTAWSIGMRKYTMSFNKYRRENGLPLLTKDFYLVNSGGDYAEWKNPASKYPGFDTKIVVWYGWGEKEPFLVWENNLYNGRNGEVLSFRYGRKNSDSLIMNYSSLDPLYIKEKDTLYWRSYRYFKSNKDTAQIFRKEQYDSILHDWGIR